VINYTFPESPEIYIHRTGRTGRAGRNGHAISLIGPTEVGSFYYLKLLYKIKPEERTLPSEAEVRSHREGERLTHLRTLLAGDPGSEWHSLARRLMVAIDAERLIGSLLRGALTGAKSDTPMKPALAVASQTEASPKALDMPTRDSAPTPSRDSDRYERGPHGDRRPRAFGERERPGRERSRRERDGGRGSDRAPRPSPAPAGRTAKNDDGREFWEVWSEEVGRTPGAAPAQATPPEVQNGIAALPTPRSEEPGAAAPADAQVASGQARLYVNLGRKDGATAEMVAEMLSSSGTAVPAADVELMNTHCYVNVARETAEALCASMNGRSHNGRAILCEPARPPKRRY
jgi:ATP-dependent RNA helicase DeaD